MIGKSAVRKPVEAVVTILVASDSSSDAALVSTLLAPEFDQVFLSTNPDLAVEDFDSRAPDVLVLAFNTMEKSERYYLGIYRLSGKIHLQPHRTIILCNKAEVNRAYQACRKERFDDYILFWPMTHDAPRLLMSVHHALRDLAVATEHGPSAAEFAAQARCLSELGSMLNQQMAQGSARIEVANRTMEQAEQDIGTALDGFSSKLAQDDLPDMARINVVGEWEQEIKRLKREVIGARFRTAAESVRPIKQWADDFRKECEPHIESARALNAMADCIRPTVLIVESMSAPSRRWCSTQPIRAARRQPAQGRARQNRHPGQPQVKRHHRRGDR
jgi:CheY-like chemotaxis protein